jgi:Tfp pilus assembly protein PilX
MAPLRALLRSERGSALLISMVMIVFLTILGLALFELGQIEGQQSGASLGDARAFELAQAGLERAIRELRNGFLADPYGSESWVDGPSRPTCTPACETGVYRTMSLTNNTLPASGTDPGGTFVVELKQVTVAEANNPISQGAGYTYPYGQTCIPSLPSNPTVCANLIFVRSTGTVAAGFPPGYQAVSTVQALVRAASTSFFASGLTAEKGVSNDPAIDGRVLIAGSIGILGSDTIDPAFRIDGGATMGVRNNWADLWPDTNTPPTLARLTPRQLICPTGFSCGGGLNLVESLGAEVKIYGNVSQTMVTLNGGTDLGINAIQTPGSYGDATIGLRRGKGRIDGVYVADGCPIPCTSSAFSFNGGSAIYVDTNNYTKPYPDRPPKLPLNSQVSVTPVYPSTEDPTLIAGTPYANWRSDFFVTHAYQVENVYPNGGNCGSNYAFSVGFNRIGDAFQTLDDDATGGQVQAGFCHTFSFTKKDGTPTNAEICWKRNVNSPAVPAPTNPPPGWNDVPPKPTLEFGIPNCDTPNNPSNPLLIRNLGRFRTRKSIVTNPNLTVQYRGAAIIAVDNFDIDIEQSLQTTCAAATNPTCAGERFPENNLLILIQRNGGDTNIAYNAPTTDLVERFMAYVFTEGRIRAWRQTNIVGSLRARQICFNNHSSVGCLGVGFGAGNPRFYQASFVDLRKIPEELPASSGASGDRWLVNVVPRFWMVCRRGPGDTLPTTPTGTCQYQ